MVTKTFTLNVGDKLKYRIAKDGFKTAVNTINIKGSDANVRTVSLEPSSTQYQSDLEYTFTENEKFAPLFLNEDFTMPDDETMVSSTALWYPYNNGLLYKCPKTDIVEKNNFTTYGNVIISNSVVSGFSTSNFIELPNRYRLQKGEFVFKFTTGNSVSSGTQRLMHYENYLCIEIISSSFKAYNWGTSSAVNLFSALTNTTYWIKVIVDGTLRKYSYSTDGINYSNEVTYTDTFVDTGSDYKLRLGLASYANEGPFLGTIDLNECYIKENNVMVWKPTVSDYEVNASKVGSIGIDSDWNVGNFSTNNYLRMNPLQLNSADNWEVVLKFNHETSSRWDVLIGSSNSSYYQRNGYSIGLSSNHLQYQISFNGTSFDSDGIQGEGSHIVSNDTDYYVKLLFDGTKYQGYISVDGNMWDLDWERDSTSKVYQATEDTIIGGANPESHSLYFNGNIDMSSCYAKINGETVWEGVKYQEYYKNYTTGGSPKITFEEASNFVSGNYIQLSNDLAKDGYTYIIKFKTGTSNYNATQDFIYLNRWLQIRIENSSFYSYSFWNGNWTSFYSGGITPDTTYWIKVRFSGNNKYLSYSLDGTDWSEEISQSDSYLTRTDRNSYFFKIGYTDAGWTFYGSIDMLETKILDGDNVIWTPHTEKASYYQGMLDKESDYNPQGGTYKLYSVQSQDKKTRLLASQSTPITDDYYQYIQDLNVEPFDEWQYSESKKEWVEMTDVQITVDDDNAEIILEEV